MRILFLTFCTAFGILSFSQNTTFFRSFNNDSIDFSVDAFQQSNGDYILLSNTVKNGQVDFQVTKTNGLGLTLWSFTYGTAGDDVSRAMVPTSDNGLVICGYSDGFTTTQDAFVTKVSSTGVVQWTKTVSTDSAEQFNAIAQSQNGDIYVTGFVDQDTMGYNVLVAKFANTGVFNWANHFGNEGEDIGNAILVDSRGTVIVAGSTKNDSVNIGSSGDQDICILALSAGGSLLQHNNIGTMNDEYATTLIQESVGTYVVGGSVGGGIDGSSDGFLSLIDTNFVMVNTIFVGGRGDEEIRDVRSLGGNSWTVASLSQSSSGVVVPLIYEVNFGAGSTMALPVAQTSENMLSDIAIAGGSANGYTLFSGGNIQTATAGNLFLTKLNDQRMVSCNTAFDILEAGQINFSRDTFTANVNVLSFSGTYPLSRTSAVNSDTTFCCELEARVAGDTVTICEGVSTNLGRSSISGYVYTWTATNFSSTSSNPLVSPIVDTEYKLVVSSPDGLCTRDSAFIYVRVNPRGSFPELIDTFFCDGSSVTVSAPDSMIFYEWTTADGRFSGSTRSVSEADTVALRFVDRRGCIYNDTVRIDNRPNPAFSLGRDTTICDNTTITLQGPINMEEYVWNGVSSPSSSLSAEVSRVYTLRVVDSFGCEFEDDIQLLTNPSSSFSLGPDTTVCTGSEVTFFGNGALTGYIWNGVLTNNPEFVAKEEGVYTAEAYNSFGCPSFDTIELSHVPLPVFSLGNDTGACDNIALQLIGPGGMKNYTWFNGSDLQVFNATGAGLYYLEVESQEGCVFTDSINLDVYTSPIISLGGDTVLRTETPLILSPGSGFDRYEWSTGESTESIEVKDKGTYSVTVTDSNGCTGSAQMEVLSSASIAGVADIKFSVYPNPASDLLYINTDASVKSGLITLLDYNGKVVLEQHMNGSMALDVSKLAAGMYILRVDTQKSRASFSVVIERK